MSIEGRYNVWADGTPRSDDTHTEQQRRDISTGQSAVYLATLRLDDFVSLDAGEEGGTMLTKPLRLRGKTLYLNVRPICDHIVPHLFEETPVPREKRATVTVAPPPRRVPLLLRGAVLFGGLVNQFGWLFLGFGTVFVWMFALQTDPSEWFDFSGRTETAKGRVVDREETGFSRGKPERGDSRPVLAHHYRFTSGGQQYEGISYSADKRAVGAPVTVEFPVGNPQRSRIEGMRAAVAPAWMLLALLFPLVGICVITPGLRAGLKAGYLLSRGQPAFGRLKEKQPLEMKINDRPVYRLTFEFFDDLGQRHEATARTHYPRQLEDDEQELLLYDPAKPARSTLIDHLHGAPYVDDGGQLRIGNRRGALLANVVPIVSIIGHSTYVWMRFLS